MTTLESCGIISVAGAAGPGRQHRGAKGGPGCNGTLAEAGPDQASHADTATRQVNTAYNE